MGNHSGVAGSCPGCGGTSVPVVYGLPGSELFAAADRGEVRLGGCIMPSGPTCRSCGSELAEDGGRGGNVAALPSVVLLRRALDGDHAAVTELLRRRGADVEAPAAVADGDPA